MNETLLLLKYGTKDATITAWLRNKESFSKEDGILIRDYMNARLTLWFSTLDKPGVT